MAVEALLSRLEKVRQRGPVNWSACCPVHKDKTPSLAIKADADGMVLLFCHGCGAKGPEICDALGLDVSELFPPREPDKHYRRPVRNGWLVNAILDESHIVWYAACHLKGGGTLSAADIERLNIASERIEMLGRQL